MLQTARRGRGIGVFGLTWKGSKLLFHRLWRRLPQKWKNRWPNGEA